MSKKTVFDHQSGQLTKIDIQPEADAKDTNDWRLAPIPIIQMVSTVWVNWKVQGGQGSIATHHINGMDYEMSMTSRADGPHVVCSERVSSNLRGSHQLRLAKLGSEIQDLQATITQHNLPIVRHRADMEALEALKKTEADPKHVAEAERQMEGWDQFEAELNAKIKETEETLVAKQSELQELLKVDLRAVKEWSFAVSELE